jgi:hypothetical protein
MLRPRERQVTFLKSAAGLALDRFSWQAAYGSFLARLAWTGKEFIDGNPERSRNSLRHFNSAGRFAPLKSGNFHLTQARSLGDFGLVHPRLEPVQSHELGWSLSLRFSHGFRINQFS